jgi:hypothetical protein
VEDSRQERVLTVVELGVSAWQGYRTAPAGHTVTPAFELSDMPAPLPINAPVTLDGPPVPPQGRIQLYSSDEWEEFIRDLEATPPPSAGLPGRHRLDRLTRDERHAAAPDHVVVCL